MKIIFLGTGTSTGVPEIGCQCKVCTSKDKRDWRLRTSAVIEIEGKRILIDCGPDFRWQVIKNKIYRLDGVLITHEHYDHVGGLDAIVDTTLYLKKMVGEKKIVYNQINMPLTAIEDFRKLGNEDPVFEKLADACDRHGGFWNKEAEDILLNEYGKK